MKISFQKIWLHLKQGPPGKVKLPVPEKELLVKMSPPLKKAAAILKEMSPKIYWQQRWLVRSRVKVDLPKGIFPQVDVLRLWGVVYGVGLGGQMLKVPEWTWVMANKYFQKIMAKLKHVKGIETVMHYFVDENGKEFFKDVTGVYVLDSQRAEILNRIFSLQFGGNFGEKQINSLNN